MRVIDKLNNLFNGVAQDTLASSEMDRLIQDADQALAAGQPAKMHKPKKRVPAKAPSDHDCADDMQVAAIGPDMTTAGSAISDLYKIVDTDDKGRGLVATKDIAAGTVITHSPVLVLAASDEVAETSSRVRDYLWKWHFTAAGVDDLGCQDLAMLLGDGNLINHEDVANCSFRLDGPAKMHTIFAARDIKAGEELSLNYGWYDNPNDYKTCWLSDRIKAETAAGRGGFKLDRSKLVPKGKGYGPHRDWTPPVAPHRLSDVSYYEDLNVALVKAGWTHTDTLDQGAMSRYAKGKDAVVFMARTDNKNSIEWMGVGSKKGTLKNAAGISAVIKKLG